MATRKTTQTTERPDLAQRAGSVLDSVDVTPLYAVVGMTDLAVERLRTAQEQAEARRAELLRQLAPSAVQERALAQVKQTEQQLRATVGRVQQLPTETLNTVLQDTAAVHDGYTQLAARGKELVERVRKQAATGQLVEQAQATRVRAAGLVTTARRAVTDAERGAKGAVTTTRKEARSLAGSLAGSAGRVAEATSEAVAAETATTRSAATKAAKRTTTATKRAGTTTRKAAARTTTSAKATTTSARKTAAAGRKATVKAAEKVGD